MWKNDLRSPKLPAKMTVATHQLQRSLQPSLTDQISLSHLLAKCELGSLVTETNQDEPPSFKEVCDHHKLNTGSLDTIFQTEDSVLNPDSFWWLSKELLYRAQAFSKRCHVEDRYLTTSLIAFLKLVKSESKYQSDGIFASFLELISNYSSLITDPTKLKSFRSTWGIDEKQNALLCLTCEWLGKHMNLFNETIAKKVEAFKLEHVSRIGDLPSAQNLVVEVFPECMQLLIGYWIGLYGTRSADSNVLQENIQSKRRTKGGGAVLASGKRADHSYSSNNSKEDINGSFSAGGTSNRPHFDSQFSKRADHSYSSSPSPLPSGINSNQVDANNQPCRDDHTYVATEDSGVNNLPPNMREDHTYVSTKERKTKSATTGCMAAGPPASADPLVGGGLEEDHDYDALPYAKRFKPSEVMTKGEPYAIILDSTKYSFVQLILEFLNNVLISGVAHVVHTRLIHS